jgi:Fic family protein
VRRLEAIFYAEFAVKDLEQTQTLIIFDANSAYNMRFIYEHSDWPRLTWNHEALHGLIGQVRYLQGRLIGKMESLGFEVRNETSLESLTRDVLKSNEIEGEILNRDQVRSSIARRLGLHIPGLVQSDRKVEGVVDMMMDATQNSALPLTRERLFGWHRSLFPEGRSGMYQIVTGKWRDDSTGPMQVVSGPLGKEKVHFQAPPADRLETEMTAFLTWFNGQDHMDAIIRAALAHFWFVTIHPFDDGNGRIARTLADLLLARADGSPQRFYSMSAQIQRERKAYYQVLQKTQSGNTDITDWMKWFLLCLQDALLISEDNLETVLKKQMFWNQHASTLMNERQKKMLNKILDGLRGKLTTSKWAKMTRCSHDTALRDIQDLLEKGILQKDPGGGRSTSYSLGN